MTGKHGRRRPDDETRNGRETTGDAESAMPEKALVILRAARKVFLAHGFSAATTDMIQKEAGVSKSTLYAHFGNKEGMFSAVIRSECKRHTEDMRLKLSFGNTLREKLLNLAKAYLRVLTKKEAVALFRIALEVSTVFPRLAELFYSSAPGCIHGFIRELFEQAVQNGELRISPTEMESAALLFAAMVRGNPHLRHLLLPWEEFSQDELDAWAVLAVDRFLLAYTAK
ncbi:MAG: TetR/AcrR family transcriptional regulator [Candidatus Accumulibacter sp.]|jgi:AcrR family transcriptional regulator|nr:TetR/AcrR family transcriptional regulator [Accumulibacter sp.]